MGNAEYMGRLLEFSELRVRLPTENDLKIPGILGPGKTTYRYSAEDAKELTENGVTIVELTPVQYPDVLDRLCFDSPAERDEFLKLLPEKCKQRRRLNACNSPALRRLLAQVRDRQLNHRDHP